VTGPAVPAPAAGSRTLLAALREAAAGLAAQGVEAPRLDAERLLAHVLGTDRLGLYLGFERALSAGEATAFEGALARRGAREPLQYILGHQAFRHLTLAVGPGVLVPRPETEEVAGAALEALAGLMPDPAAPATALDLGTGSGCIALALAAERPGTGVVAVDVSAAALAVARSNARSLGLEARVRFLEGDLYGALAGTERFDLIVSNPPYLTPAEWAAAAPEVRDHEPREALVGGVDGLAVQRRILAGAAQRLAPGGCVVLEIGAGQGAAVPALAREAGFTAEVRRDLAGRDRIVIARRTGEG
jgi:release factor glutamine methyltransferase